MVTAKSGGSSYGIRSTYRTVDEPSFAGRIGPTTCDPSVFRLGADHRMTG